MTPYLFLILYLALLLMAVFRHPINGLWAYMLVFYLAPAESWWRSSIPDLRYLLIAAVITGVLVVSRSAESSHPSWLSTGAGKLVLALGAWFWVQTMWSVTGSVQVDGAILFSKHVVTYYIIYKLLDSRERLIQFAMVHVVGCAWFGYQALGAGGGRLETIGGAVSGSNSLGMHVATAVMFTGIIFISFKGRTRWIAFACTPLIVNCLILTISRGAFVGLICGGAAGYFLSAKLLRKYYVLAGVLAIALFTMLAHDDLIERFNESLDAIFGLDEVSTLEESNLDNSALSRVAVAKLNFRMGLEYPLGVGYRGTNYFAPTMLEERYLDGTGGRASHNTLLATFAEQGFPGAFIFIGFMWWSLITIRNVRRRFGGAVPDDIAAVIQMAGAGLAVYFSSGMFSNFLQQEVHIWCMAMLASAAAIAHTLPAAETAVRNSRSGARRFRAA